MMRPCVVMLITMAVTRYAKGFDYDGVIELLPFADTTVPVVTLMAMQGSEPYKVLFTTLMSARTKDTTTLPAARRLFSQAPNLQALSRLDVGAVERLIYPVGFYKTKALHIVQGARMLIDEFGGVVPKTVEELTRLPGVGRKTAHLVLAEAFGVPVITVDTHVHRISNRLGIVKTLTVDETQLALERCVPKRLWTVWNPTLVAHGQTICTPISPKCSQCAVAHLCKRVGVHTYR